MCNCTICGKKIILVPSARERARKFGGQASDYTKLFTAHSECVIEKRKRESSELMARYRSGGFKR